MNGTHRHPGPTAWLVLLVWFAAALGAAASGVLPRLPVPPPAIAGVITVALLIALGISTSMREKARAFGLRHFVLFHVVRIAAGAYFLILLGRGELPSNFALVAGWGDIAVGVGALVVWWICFPLRSSWQRGTLLTWNVLGLLDILLVLGNGARLFLRDPSLAEGFTRLPLALLPTFLVPIVIVSHVLLFAWSRDPQRSSSG